MVVAGHRDHSTVRVFLMCELGGGIESIAVLSILPTSLLFLLLFRVVNNSQLQLSVLEVLRGKPHARWV